MRVNTKIWAVNDVMGMVVSMAGPEIQLVVWEVDVEGQGVLMVGGTQVVGEERITTLEKDRWGGAGKRDTLLG